MSGSAAPRSCGGSSRWLRGPRARHGHGHCGDSRPGPGGLSPWEAMATNSHQRARTRVSLRLPRAGDGAGAAPGADTGNGREKPPGDPSPASPPLPGAIPAPLGPITPFFRVFSCSFPHEVNSNRSHLVIYTVIYWRCNPIKENAPFCLGKIFLKWDCSVGGGFSVSENPAYPAVYIFSD